MPAVGRLILRCECVAANGQTWVVPVDTGRVDLTYKF